MPKTSCSKSMSMANWIPVRNPCQQHRIDPSSSSKSMSNLIVFLFEINAKPSCSRSLSKACCIPVRNQCQHRLQCSLHRHLTRHVWPHHFRVEWRECFPERLQHGAAYLPRLDDMAFLSGGSRSVPKKELTARVKRCDLDSRHG